MNNHTQNKYFSNFVFLFFAQYSSMAATIFLSIILTRFLQPEHYGELAKIIFFFSFFNWATDWGLENSLMIAKEEELSAALCCNLFFRIFSSSLPIILLFSCGHMFLSQPAYHLFMLYSISYIFEKTAIVYKTILEKFSYLKTVSIIEMCASLLSFCVAIFAAMQGYIFFALVLQKLVEKGYLFFGFLLMSPIKWSLDFDRGFVKKAFKVFGLACWTANIAGICIYDFVPFVVSSLAGSFQGGLYVKSFSLATLPLTLTTVFNKITTPLYAKNSLKYEQIRQCFLLSQLCKFLILLPIQFFLFITARWWIPFVLGSQWEVIVPIYQFLSLYGFARAFYDDLGPLVNLGLQAPWEMAQNQALHASLLLLLAPALVWWKGALGGALCVSLAMCFVSIGLWVKILRRLLIQSKHFGLAGAVIFILSFDLLKKITNS